ncbi:MAG: hypothetical protein U5S82_06025 [Gammaproteobacteria bacterium]|nr:hypothetical protein [Gammaproteobacteria bacterium]
MGRLIPLLAGLALCAPVLQAQWQSMGVGGDGRASAFFAVVGNPAGDRFEVRRQDDGTVTGLLVLREGFESFPPDHCPTLVVDMSAPIGLAARNGPCRIDGHRAGFVFGTIEDGRIGSTHLVRLMDGQQVMFRFHVDGRGYRETRFPLRGSKNALTNLLGTDVVVEVR